MSTNVTPAPETATSAAVQVSTKMVTGVAALLTLQVQVGNKFDSLALQAAADAKQYGYDKKRARDMVAAAFEKAHTEQAKKDKVPQDQMNAHIAALLQKSGPDISKIITLGFPKDEAAAIELQKAKDAGLGINHRLNVSRGNTTVEAIMQERANAKAGASKETARPQGNATTQAGSRSPQAPAPETPAVSKLTPKERLANQFVAFVKFGESLGLERAEVLDTLSDLISEATAELEKTQK